jgi:hypothetical protein
MIQTFSMHTKLFVKNSVKYFSQTADNKPSNPENVFCEFTRTFYQQ